MTEMVQKLDKITLVDFLVGLAGMGFEIFPLWPNSKNPRTSHGLRDATSDTEVIAHWWQMWPDANYGKVAR